MKHQDQNNSRHSPDEDNRAESCDFHLRSLEMTLACPMDIEEVLLHGFDEAGEITYTFFNGRQEGALLDLLSERLPELQNMKDMHPAYSEDKIQSPLRRLASSLFDAFTPKQSSKTPSQFSVILETLENKGLTETKYFTANSSLPFLPGRAQHALPTTVTHSLTREGLRLRESLRSGEK